MNIRELKQWIKQVSKNNVTIQIAPLLANLEDWEKELIDFRNDCRIGHLDFTPDYLTQRRMIEYFLGYNPDNQIQNEKEGVKSD